MKKLAPILAVCSLIACSSESTNTGSSGGGAGGSAGSGGATGGSGGATGGAAGSGGATGGAAGSGGATGGAAGSGGATGGVGVTGGATGGTGGATGGTGGANPIAAAADEIGVLFYAKNSSNSLRWIKTDGKSQRTATSFSMSGDWSTATSVAPLAGAGAEIVFHNSQNKLAAPLLITNDATTGGKTNATLGAGYDLATKRSAGKVMWLDGKTGAWLTGGWGSSTWAQDGAGTITLPAATTFEHFHRCGTSSYLFYSTGDTLLYRRVFGADFTMATQMAVPASSHAVCVGVSEQLTFLFSDANGTGKLYSGSTEIKSWSTAWTFGKWTHIVNLRNGMTLFYDKTTGGGAVGQFTDTPADFVSKALFSAGTFPMQMDLVVAL